MRDREPEGHMWSKPSANSTNRRSQVLAYSTTTTTAQSQSDEHMSSKSAANSAASSPPVPAHMHTCAHICNIFATVKNVHMGKMISHNTIF